MTEDTLPVSESLNPEDHVGQNVNSAEEKVPETADEKKEKTLNPLEMPTVILPRDGEDSLRKAKSAARAVMENRGQNVVILDMRKLSPAFDYFVIATGSSNRQLHAMSDAVDDIFEKEMNLKKLGTEGYQESKWILLDYGDVVIHLFDAETREYFRLEQLWGAAEPVEFSVVEN
ncbi:MAG: ribosome silencing factor [Planctomycetia bacterium]|nr:ribosome silencing factor [Planctomycetia bacterium]